MSLRTRHLLAIAMVSTLSILTQCGLTLWNPMSICAGHVSFFASTEPFSTGGVYVNFLGNEGEKQVMAAYGEAEYERLVALKKQI